MMQEGFAEGRALRMSAEEVNIFLAREFPQIAQGGLDLTVTETRFRFTQARLAYSDRHLRPGGTISGPAMFALADVAMYACILAHYGPVALAVTTNLNINFLRKPERRDLIAEARLLKPGRRLAVGEIALYSEGVPDMVAHATSTYSLPD
jgi:uncharacterized protein (TIGR00369 family)